MLIVEFQPLWHTIFVETNAWTHACFHFSFGLWASQDFTRQTTVCTCVCTCWVRAYMYGTNTVNKSSAKDLFSRRRWRLVSAQLSIKFRYCPSYTVSIVLSFYQHSSYLLGRYESSSLVSCRAPRKGIVNYADILMCELSDFIKLHSTQMAR